MAVPVKFPVDLILRPPSPVSSPPGEDKPARDFPFAGSSVGQFSHTTFQRPAKDPPSPGGEGRVEGGRSSHFAPIPHCALPLEFLPFASIPDACGRARPRSESNARPVSLGGAEIFIRGRAHGQHKLAAAGDFLVGNPAAGDGLAVEDGGLNVGIGGGIIAGDDGE